MHNNIFATLIVVTLTLTACHSDKNPSKGDFAKVIQKSIQGKCDSIPWDQSFPESIDMRYLEGSPGQNMLEALVRAGLLHSQDVKSTEDYTKLATTTRTYSLTELGKQQYALRDFKTIFGGSVKKGTFCVTTYKVDEVTNFTIPAQNNLAGILASQVFFTYSPDKVSEWAKGEAIQTAFPEIKKKLATGQSGNAQLVLTNDGWMDSADMK